MKSISQILIFLGIQVKNDVKVQIEFVFLDSRKCNEESAFIALRGQTTDGNKYIKNVISKGVNLVLTDSIEFEDRDKIFYVEDLKNKLASFAIWFYDYKKPKNIIGITGTNGKTSISNYIAQFIDLNAQKTLLLGTNGNGIYPDLKESSHTTLDVLSLYQTVSSYSDYENLIMEVSSHALDQKRVAGLDFDTAVFSNLSHDHLDYHKTMDAYFEAKAKLFQFKSLKKVVINVDDDYSKKLCAICSCEVVTVSLKSKQADIYLKVSDIKNMQTSFDLYIAQEFVGGYKTCLIGEFNLMNLGLSLAALDGYIAREQVLANVDLINPVKGRMEVIQLTNNVKVIIDYAHTPEALEKALQTLKDYSLGTLWCIFGCGGDRDITKRPEMASIAERYADKIIITEDNNRFEDLGNIFNDIQKGFVNANQHKFISSREEAIKYAIENSKAGDVILLAGKGHECYLDKKGVKRHFDEREIIKRVIL
ncbi:UDP-N-acetylmuramoyl-L-alanyl-D-glutamate--2,6-diaminopimelate ligase [Francisella halioticida]|uniref:UDP-N-acetylmuramyl-tripeptide synthetase n=1 Tax=Francisella halioticida TaxID=549298 RepID=A0ABM6M0K7_9GAMM|nr:UDP-N-acetylmuramoyl-L-alanyl-D-glutamate--2,6-diaminopimelate ligase [Francisella halioticida]ASG68425.1 UDP-N-acetylmuramoyl-L-alanyl-D-glutamate--2,6-diaminopimelate ligase [Francisella halioticida]